MSRLTYRNPTTGLAEKKISFPKESHIQKMYERNILQKLAAYEDICPDPEEIAKQLAEQKRITSVMAEVRIEKDALSTMLKQALYNQLANLIVNELMKHPEYYEIKTTNDFKKDDVRYRMKIKVVSLLANEEGLR